MRALVFGLAAGLLVAACAGSEPVSKQDTPAASSAIAVTYSTSNGTVAPPYRWDLDYQIAPEGTGTLTRCTGYQQSGPDCMTETFTVPAAKRAAIAAAVEAGGFAGRPATEMKQPPVGGGATVASVTIGTVTVALPAYPNAPDVARVNAVRDAITASIPSGTVEKMARAQDKEG